ncbi:MAG: cohesin domain-containing protein, partial [bacterium]
MGKRTSFVIWLTMILFWAPGLPAQQAVLSVIGSSGLAGSGGNIVWIDLDNTTAGPVSGLQFDLGFDPGVLSVEQVVRTRRTDSSTMALFDWNVYQEGKLRVVMTGIGTTIAPDTGSIADISFEVAEDALPGDYPLTLSNVLLVDVQTEITDGVFTVAEETVLKVIGGSGVPGSAGNAVPIDLANNIGIGGIAFTLSYDATLLTVTDVEATSKTDHMSTLTWSEPHPGVVNLLIADTAGAIIAPVKGAIAHFHFDVSADAPHGDIGLTLSDVVISDPQGAPVDVISVDGVFTVGVPEIAISDTSHNFGDVQIDNSAIWPFTIYNYGSAALRIDSIAADRSEFG